MSKIIFSFLIFLFVNPIFAQLPEMGKLSPPIAKNSSIEITDNVSMLTILHFGYQSESDSSLSTKTVNEYNPEGKLTSHASFLWDKYSISYIKDEKEEYMYDAQGNKIEYKYWYGDGDWIENQKKYWHYNQDNKETKYILVGMDMSSNFDTLEIHRTEYNENGNISTLTDSTKRFVNNTFYWEITKTTHFYDANQNDTTINQYKQNESTKEWEINFTTYNKFDGENHLIETSSTDGVNLGNKVVYNYNTDGYLDTIFSYRPMPDGDSIIWQLNVKIEYTYTVEGWPSRILIWTYDQQKEMMVKTRQTNTTYNANGDEIEVIQMLDAGFDKGLINFGKSSFVYDNSGNLIEESYFTWMETTEEWYLQTKKTRTYKDGLLKIVTFNDSGYNFPVSRDFYFYNDEIVTHSLLVQHTNVTVYPNPINSNVIISDPKSMYCKISIFNLQGQKIYTQELTGTNTVVPMSAYKAGTYFVVLEGNEKIKKIKLIKR